MLPIGSDVVETSGGKLRGSVHEGVFAFRGVPYGADTGGANRFQPPKSFAWVGVRDALRNGPRAPQHEPGTTAGYLTWLRDSSPSSENCLVLNVFTPTLDEHARCPVMVYLHGGGFSISSGGTPGVDGGNLARRGVVVVTLNHRLNVFGHLHLGDADGGRYADAGNVGMLDIVAALHWVRENISVFGGDAGNVTVFGQSGGGSKVGVLMAMPQAQGLFHKAIIQSASSLLSMATVEEGERNTHHFLDALGLHRGKLEVLQQLPADTLLSAMQVAVQQSGGVDNYRPTVDGRALPWQPFDVSAVQLSAGIPLMTGWCENEQRLNFASTPGIYRQSMAMAVASTANVVGVPPDQAERLLAVYSACRPADAPGDLYAQICGDYRYRRTVTTAADIQARHASSPVYMYLLRWKTPVLGGLLRTPHTLCIPFAFGNVVLATGITGFDPDVFRLQEEMAGAWVAFARTGSPNHPGLPAWPAYMQSEHQTMVFDRRTAASTDPLQEERVALAPLPPYVAAKAQGLLPPGVRIS